MARRSMTSAGLSVGAPCTCERKPSSACFAARVIPDFASRRLASTSWALFPMDETMPIPVMTTRLMIASPCRYAGVERYTRRCTARSRRSRRRCALLEHPDLQVLCAIDNLAIHGKPAVGDAEHQL